MPGCFGIRRTGVGPCSHQTQLQSVSVGEAAELAVAQRDFGSAAKMILQMPIAGSRSAEAVGNRSAEVAGIPFVVGRSQSVAVGSQSAAAENQLAETPCFVGAGVAAVAFGSPVSQALQSNQRNQSIPADPVSFPAWVLFEDGWMWFWG